MSAAIFRHGPAVKKCLALLLCVALAGCARLEKFDPRTAPDASGRVVDARTGAPVAARVYYQDTPNEVVVSSADGRFRFPALRRSYSEVAGLERRGVRWLAAEAHGYRQGLKEVDPAAPGGLVIALEPAP